MRHRRRKKFVKPEVQRHWAIMLLLVTGVSMLGQGILLMFILTRLALELPNDGELVVASIPGNLAWSMGLTFLFLAPFLVVTAVLVSFRFAGPIYRFEQYLKQVIAGDRPPACRLRKGDQLTDLCDLINEATEPLYRSDVSHEGEEHSPSAERRIA